MIEASYDEKVVLFCLAVSPTPFMCIDACQFSNFLCKCCSREFVVFVGDVMNSAPDGFVAFSRDLED